jgi:invasion protein IalB
MLSSTNRIVVVAVVVALIAISAAAIYFGAGRFSSDRSTVPPIEKADVQPGFVGQHKFGLWTLACENAQSKTAEAAPVYICRANVRVMIRAGAGTRPLLAAGLNVVMMKSQAGPAMLFRLPPAARAADSIDFAIDENATFKAPLRCSETECIAQGALPADAVEQLRTGRKLSLVYTVKDQKNQDRKVRVDQDLHGFREAFDAMVRAMSAA